MNVLTKCEGQTGIYIFDWLEVEAYYHLKIRMVLVDT